MLCRFIKTLPAIAAQTARADYACGFESGAGLRRRPWFFRRGTRHTHAHQHKAQPFAHLIQDTHDRFPPVLPTAILLCLGRTRSGSSGGSRLATIQDIECSRRQGLVGISQQHSYLPHLRLVEHFVIRRHARQTNAIFNLPISLAWGIVAYAHYAVAMLLPKLRRARGTCTFQSWTACRDTRGRLRIARGRSAHRQPGWSRPRE